MNLSMISESEQSSVVKAENNSAKNTPQTDAAQQIQKIKTSLFKQERKRLTKIVKQIRKATNQEQFLKNTVTIIRQILAVDRVIIYRCEDNNNGQVVAESLVKGWTPTQDEIIPCTCFGAIQKNDYQSQEFIAIEDRNNSQLTPHQKQLLERFQVQASLAVPLLLDSYFQENNAYALNKVWGLIVIQQCSQTRQWQEEEINLLYQLSGELTRVLQPPLPRLHSRKRQSFITVINQEMQQLMKGMLHEIRQSIQADRVWIYSFNPDGSGEVLDESVDSQWKKAASSFDNDSFLTAENCKSQYVVNDIYAQDFAPCLIEALEAQSAKAYIAIPILHNQQLSGILAAFQNSDTRNWQESEVELMVNYADKFSLPLQQTSFIRTSRFQAKQLQKQAEQEKASNRIIERIRKTLDIDEIFTVATQEIRQVLKADRTVVYQFNQDWSGQVVAESVASGWVSLLVEQTNNEVLSGDRTQSNRCILRKWAVDDITDTDTYMEKTKGGKYMKGEKFTAVNDIYTQKFPDCYIASLEKYQARAYIITPIFQGEKLWGLLGVYQNSGTRAWQEPETEQMLQIANQLAIALQQADYVEKLKQKAKEQVTVAEQAQATTTIINKIRESQDVNTIFKVTTKEVRKALKTDRTIVYQFNEDWSGQVIAESVESGWVSLLIEQNNDEVLLSDRTTNERCLLRKWSAGDIISPDSFLQQTQGGRYVRGQKITVVEDIYAQKFPDCYIESLEKYQAQAYMIAPIFQKEKLWGLLGVYQNSGTRTWQKTETQLMMQIASQLAVALQQAAYVEQLKKQAEEQVTVAEQAQATTTIINKIRESQDVNTIFKVTTKEVRKALKTDRTIVYQFNEDWSGQVIAESVDSGWVSLLIEQNNDEVLLSDRTTNERCLLRKWSAGDIISPDSFLQQTQGGRYVRGQKITVVEDIYAQKFPDCYIESLEKYQARAYMIAPIFQKEKLWGLLGVYQNSGTRTWQKTETQLMMQIASQLAVALQQASYLNQIEIQTKELEKTIQRERSAKEELQKQAVEMLRTVRPAFSGDLTVRANVTENEIGTIAGAYNTTLDSLKDIVLQVQTAVGQVAQTTGNSSTAVEGLSIQSEKQLQELQQALTQIQSMIDASAITTKNAQQVESAIEQADRTVQQGDRAMNDTVDSILGIRQTVADAVKRVKRLSDSSQKISRVVNLIGSFATQTNLLALNAALEATRAGEYGKGFAVVADEVRNLSLQSSDATTEIEKLVREIQEETQEVAIAMDAGIEQVSQGTNLVNQTRESLNAVVASTAEIRHLVQDITSAANAQTKQAESVTQVMGQVAEIANETSTGSQQISSSFQELQQLAQNLQSSVAQFKVK